MFGVFRSKRDLDRLIREPMDNEEEEFFDDNDSDVLDNEIGSRHNFQRYFIIIKEAPMLIMLLASMCIAICFQMAKHS